jgi:hypothetical protein
VVVAQADEEAALKALGAHYPAGKRIGRATDDSGKVVRQ